jgi:hypothetical protein
MTRPMFASWPSYDGPASWVFLLMKFGRLSGSADLRGHRVAKSARLPRIISTIFAPRSLIFAGWRGCWQKPSPNARARRHQCAPYWTFWMFVEAVSAMASSK